MFAHSFVRVKLDNGQEMSLVKVLFKLLLQYGIIDVSDFVAWSEDECEESLFASKSKALIQTCDFLLAMQEIQNSISTTDDDEQSGSDKENDKVCRMDRGSYHATSPIDMVGMHSKQCSKDAKRARRLEVLSNRLQ